MRAIFSSMLIILASSTLGKEATLEQYLKDNSDLSQVSYRVNECVLNKSMNESNRVLHNKPPNEDTSVNGLIHKKEKKSVLALRLYVCK